MAYNPYFYQNQNYQSYQNPLNQSSGGIIWVQGEAGAKSYPVAPNNTVLLMDSESPRFYIKTADASGVPLPLRIFNYEEITADSIKTGDISASNAKDVKSEDYVTKSEFDAFKDEIRDSIKKDVKKDE